MKTRISFSIILTVLAVLLAVFASRSILRPEKFKTVYELRKGATVNNLLAIRSAQAVYKNVHKKYAADIDTLADFVENGTVEVEKTIGNFPDTMSQEEAFKLGLIHKEIVKVPAIEKILELDANLSKESFKNFKYIPFSDKKKKYEIQTGEIASKTYTIPVYKIDVPLDDILINMEKSITPDNAGVFKKFWNKIYFNNLDGEKQYRSQYEDIYMGSLTEAATTGSWE